MTRLPLLKLIAGFSGDYRQGPCLNLIVPGDCDLSVNIVLFYEMNLILLSNNHPFN